MSEKPLLTISLLSSGRKDTIERCLSSLAPFREQLETEIIVVDTDPSHGAGVHAVLEKYAGEIIPFEWCDDFAAARNAGVDAAGGEWFLYVDDDEWFIDAQPLIDFLKSDGAKDCDRVNYRIRNYRDEEHAVYGDAWVTRLFRLDGGTRFAGRVHEYIVPDYGTVRNIDALAGHSGYIFHTEEERKAHTARNAELLRRMMEEEPREVRWVLQLMMQYGEQDDGGNELAMARKGYQMMEDAEGYRFACVRGLFAATRLRVLCEEGKYRECADEYRKIQTDRKQLGKVPKAYMEHLLALAFFHLGETDRARRHCLGYWEAYDRLHDAPVEYVEEHTYFLTATWDGPVYGLMADAYMRLEAARTDSGRDGRFAERAREFWRREPERGMLQEFLLAWQTEKEETANAAYWRLTEALATADGLSPEPLDIKIVWDDHEGVRGHMPDYFRRLFAATNPLMVDPLLWRIGMRRGAVLDDRIRELPAGRWRAYVDECARTAASAHMRQMLSVMDDVYLGLGDERYGYFQSRISEVLRWRTDGF